MRKNIYLCVGELLGLVILVACSSQGSPMVKPPPTAAPQTGVNLPLPTSISPGTGIDNENLRIQMKQAEITSSFITEKGLTRVPPEGHNILWINISIKNIGQIESSLPAVEHFSVLYGQSEFKSGYGHRQGITDYSTLEPMIFGGQEVDAWLRFDIPETARLKDLQFAFLPGSFQVNFSFPSNGYSWADRPIYLWQCAP